MDNSLFSVNSNQKSQWYGLWTNASAIENEFLLVSGTKN